MMTFIKDKFEMLTLLMTGYMTPYLLLGINFVLALISIVTQEYSHVPLIVYGLMVILMSVNLATVITPALPLSKKSGSLRIQTVLNNVLILGAMLIITITQWPDVMAVVFFTYFVQLILVMVVACIKPHVLTVAPIVAYRSVAMFGAGEVTRDKLEHMSSDLEIIFSYAMNGFMTEFKNETDSSKLISMRVGQYTTILMSIPNIGVVQHGKVVLSVLLPNENEREYWNSQTRLLAFPNTTPTLHIRMSHKYPQVSPQEFERSVSKVYSELYS